MVASKQKKKMGTEGNTHVLMALILLVFTLGGLGTFGVLRKWRTHVETQLRLNRCVGKAAQEFRDVLESLLQRNREIRQLRVAIQAVQWKPWLIPPLRTALGAVVLRQEFSLNSWRVRTLQWRLSQGCDGRRKDDASSLPSLNFTREPPDLIGPKPLVWLGGIPGTFTFLLKSAPRAAAAVVQTKGSEGEENAESEEDSREDEKWVAIWAIPR